MIKPISVIYPEGGEPLYEDNSGLRWTAQDFAARYGYETTQAFLDSLKTPKYSYKGDDLND
jgi:hypothetical protein